MINKHKGLIFAEACLDNRPAAETVSLRLVSCTLLWHLTSTYDTHNQSTVYDPYVYVRACLAACLFDWILHCRIPGCWKGEPKQPVLLSACSAVDKPALPSLLKCIKLAHRHLHVTGIR
jgi:hypothetical protein